MRLTAAGASAVEQLISSGAGTDRPTMRLARRLVDGGLAHPRPRPVDRQDVTIVVPVRDRLASLDACLASAGGPALVVDDGSRYPEAVAAVCARHRARLVRREISGGPAAARNAGLACVETPLVAFVDSDCVPEPLWLERLIGHFADASVAAVAPRIRAVSSARGPVGRFAVARSPIDLGDRPARVVPTGRVSYVPTATLIVRRSAVSDGFDERLRFGEDVDFVWRLHATGWTVRYDPEVSVSHREPARWRALVRRHYQYGTGAANLARRHPRQVPPLILEPWAASIAAALLSGRPRLAVVMLAARIVHSAGAARHAGLKPWRAATWPLHGAWGTTLATGRALATLAPALLVAAMTTRRFRMAGLVLLVAPPIAEWAKRRPDLDPLRWICLCLADDAAYGLGVWKGCMQERTLDPLTPALRGSATTRHVPGVKAARDLAPAGRPRRRVPRSGRRAVWPPIER
jgi:mycofactocin system glycosyltransferase